MNQEFKSEDEFRDFLGEMEIIEHEAEEAGRYCWISSSSA